MRSTRDRPVTFVEVQPKIQETSLEVVRNSEGMEDRFLLQGMNVKRKGRGRDLSTEEVPRDQIK